MAYFRQRYRRINESHLGACPHQDRPVDRPWPGGEGWPTAWVRSQGNVSALRVLAGRGGVPKTLWSRLGNHSSIWLLAGPSPPPASSGAHRARRLGEWPGYGVKTAG